MRILRRFQILGVLSSSFLTQYDVQISMRAVNPAHPSEEPDPQYLDGFVICRMSVQYLVGEQAQVLAHESPGFAFPSGMNPTDSWSAGRATR